MEESLCGAESRHSAEIWNRHQMAHKRAIENRWVVTYNEYGFLYPCITVFGNLKNTSKKQ